MRRYAAQRLLAAFPTFFLSTGAIFIVMRIAPGDLAFEMLGEFASHEAIEELRASLGLDQPIWRQYVDWITGLLRGDLDTSVATNQTVADMLIARVPVTLEIAILATIFGAAFGILIGILAAVRPDTLLDYLFRSIAIGGLSVPNFWLALLALMLPVYLWGYFPPRYVDIWQDPVQHFQAVWMAVVILGVPLSASTMRMTRATLLEVLRQDYIRTAHAKGLTSLVVIRRHALKNAILPVITIIGLQFGVLIGGSIIIESIFSLPGVGAMAITALQRRDLVVVQGFVIFITATYVVISIMLDFTYALLDPRIRFA